MEKFDSDALDQVRGVLYALANRSEAFYCPVSTLSIRCALERRNRSIAPADTLEALYSIGDVQRLTGGYWLPVITALVPLGSSAIVISGAPTQIVEEHLRTVVRSMGYSRIASHLTEAAASLPQRTFLSWCGAPPITTVWVKQYITDAAFTRQFIDEGFECFNHWMKRTDTRWLDNHHRNSIPDGVVLARVRTPVGKLYLLCRFLGGRPISISEIGYQWSIAWRLALGLRALQHNPSKFQVRRDDVTTATIIVTRFLPSEELMVLHALGEVREYTATQIAITLDEATIAPTVQMLTSLGLEMDGD